MAGKWLTSIRNNSKVVENYFFMTALQLISSLFGILIYPYVIRVLGAESYGLYVFALSVSSYFVGFVSFGFTFPAIKGIVENKNDISEKSKIVSSVMSAKIYLTVLSVIVFAILIVTVPLLKVNKLIFIICYMQIISEILFPSWYFQAVQKMKIVTYIQLTFRLLSLPFIFIFIKNPTDTCLYALITTLTLILSSFFLVGYLLKIEKLRLFIIPFKSLKTCYAEATPFFWTNTVAMIKQESVTTIIGAFFGMRDVAIYDLANKVVALPRMLTMSINGALFPKVIDNVPRSTIKKIIKYETAIGLFVITLIVIFGPWVIKVLGGPGMMDSYPIAIILSGTILAWLVVGCYNNFIFVPMKKYYYIFQGQVIALISLLLCVAGIFIYKDILIIALAYTISGFSELAYCRYRIKRHKIL